jgi:excisionase family DNA binding protein
MTLPTDVALLRLDEVASRLKVSMSTIRRLIRRNDLKAVRVGRQLRVRPADLNTYLQRNTEGKDQ